MSTVTSDKNATEVGSYFVSNYPPYSVWSADHLSEARAAIDTPPKAETPLGLYMHIPFCRKRCRFCYFRVFIDKNAKQIETYIQALIKEVELYSRHPVLSQRPFRFVYFGGGTPSYLSEKQLRGLIDRLREYVNWDEAEEVTFECEPGTLRESKLEAIKDIGVTRLSLGVEHFNDKVLELNGRAHLSAEIERSYKWAREAGFDQINIDLIAGMLGDDWDSWKDCVARAVDMGSDSVTIYQMELPFNTLISEEIKEKGQSSVPVADWDTKRAWAEYAFSEFRAAGYENWSVYTMVRDKEKSRFIYTDALWRGSDMLGIGVASISHIGGVHFQNLDQFEPYLNSLLERGELPLARAYKPDQKQLLIRELVLQLKRGWVSVDYFQDKFGVDIGQAFAEPFATLADQGLLAAENGQWMVSPKGMLRVDGMLSNFFEPEFRNVRYS